MFEFEVARNPQTIADEINAIKREVEGAIINGAIEIGKRLCEVKAMVAVGSWGQWLQENVEYSERTAQNMMAVYNEYGKKGIPEGLKNASLTNALAMIGLPEDIKHELLDSGAPEEMSSREFKAEIEKLKAEKADMQCTIDGLIEDIKEAEKNAETVEAEASRQAERVKEMLKDAENEKEEMRRGMLEATADAKSRSEELAQLRRERDEIERRLREAEQSVKMEPAVIEKDTPETLEKLRRLEEQLGGQKSESEGMVLFRAAWKRFVDVFRECESLIGRVEGDDGPDEGKRLREALAASARKMASQVERA